MLVLGLHVWKAKKQKSISFLKICHSEKASIVTPIFLYKSWYPLSFCYTLNFYLKIYLKAYVSKKWHSNLLLFIEIEIKSTYSKIKYKYNNVLLYIKFKFIMNDSKCWCLCIQPKFIIFIFIYYLVWEILFLTKRH